MKFQGYPSFLEIPDFQAHTIHCIYDFSPSNMINLKRVGQGK